MRRLAIVGGCALVLVASVATAQERPPHIVGQAPTHDLAPLPSLTPEQAIAIFSQVYEHWIISHICEMQGGDDLQIRVSLTLAPDGRIVDGPRLREPQADPVYMAGANEAMRALRQAAPFTVPEGFRGGRFPLTFNTARACANR